MFLRVTLLTTSRKPGEALRGDVRAEVGGFAVPLSRLCNIGLDPEAAELIDDNRVKRLSQHQGGIRATSVGGSPQQNSGCSKITAL
jgi:hypothetical protein